MSHGDPKFNEPKTSLTEIIEIIKESIRDKIFWDTLQLILSRHLNPFPAPKTFPPCPFETAGVRMDEQTCKKQCTNPVYRDGQKFSDSLNGKKLVTFCCPVGYTGGRATSPLTGEITVICIKE